GLAGAQVEDLLHAVLDSVEAVLGNRHRQRGELLVLLRQGPVGEYALAQIAEGARHLHGAAGHEPVETLPFLGPLVQVEHQLSSLAGAESGAPGLRESMRDRARASAIPRTARSSRMRHCWTSPASWAVGSAIQARAESRLSAWNPSVGDSACSRSRRSSGGNPAARRRDTTAPRTAAFQMPVRASSRAA